MISIYELGKVSDDRIFARAYSASDVSAAVGEIIENVKKNGDRALLAYTEKFDGVKLESIKVTKEEIDEALDG